MAGLLAKYRALPACLEVIRDYLDRAADSLDALPANPGRGRLRDLTTYLARQTQTLRADSSENGL
jgi:hypothetical protein